MGDGLLQSNDCTLSALSFCQVGLHPRFVQAAVSILVLGLSGDSGASSLAEPRSSHFDEVKGRILGHLLLVGVVEHVGHDGVGRQ